MWTWEAGKQRSQSAASGESAELAAGARGAGGIAQALDRLLCFSEPQFPHLENEDGHTLGNDAGHRPNLK